MMLRGGRLASVGFDLTVSGPRARPSRDGCGLEFLGDCELVGALRLTRMACLCGVLRYHASEPSCRGTAAAKVEVINPPARSANYAMQ